MQKGKVVKNVSDEKLTKNVSVRLPNPIVSILKNEVELSGTTQSDIVRRALILYRRAHGGVLVPLDAAHRNTLMEISDTRRVPYEHLLTSWVVKAIEEEHKECMYFSWHTSSQTRFTPSKAPLERPIKFVTSSRTSSLTHHAN